MINKKAQYLMPIWAILFFIFAMAVLFSISIYYSKAIDVRKVEADILRDRIIECLNDNGKLNPAIDFADENSLIETCDFYLNEKNKKDYYIKISLNSEKVLEIGVKQEYADITEFSEKNIFLIKDKEFAEINVVAGVNKKGENLGKKNV